MDYFKENREGIFLQRKSIPMYVGLSTKPWVNIGKMRNSGIDARSNTTNRSARTSTSPCAAISPTHATGSWTRTSLITPIPT